MLEPKNFFILFTNANVLYSILTYDFRILVRYPLKIRNLRLSTLFHIFLQSYQKSKENAIKIIIPAKVAIKRPFISKTKKNQIHRIPRRTQIIGYSNCRTKFVLPWKKYIPTQTSNHSTDPTVRSLLPSNPASKRLNAILASL